MRTDQPLSKLDFFWRTIVSLIGQYHDCIRTLTLTKQKIQTTESQQKLSINNGKRNTNLRIKII